MTDATSTSAASDDLIRPFQIDRWELRGRYVRMGPAIDAVLKRHAYPPVAARLLGEGLVLTACLASSLKFEGKFTLQAKGEHGPVRMLVADVTDDGAIRGYLSFDEDELDTLTKREADPSAARLFGGGYLAFTVDQGADFERYQGVVELEGASLADSVHHYFRQSEQIETLVKLACDQAPDGSGDWRAAGVMIQRLPEQQPGGRAAAADADEGWNRAALFLGSATSSELLDADLTADQLLYRLFHEDGVRVWEARPLVEECRCGQRERMASVLGAIPREEVDTMKTDEGDVSVRCEFCAREERFSDADLDAIYAARGGDAGSGVLR